MFSNNSCIFWKVTTFLITSISITFTTHLFILLLPLLSPDLLAPGLRARICERNSLSCCNRCCISARHLARSCSRWSSSVPESVRGNFAWSIDGVVQDCGISSILAMEIPQSQVNFMWYVKHNGLVQDCGVSLCKWAESNYSIVIILQNGHTWLPIAHSWNIGCILWVQCMIYELKGM